jgi:hypothetical protein
MMPNLIRRRLIAHHANPATASFRLWDCDESNNGVESRHVMRPIQLRISIPILSIVVLLGIVLIATYAKIKEYRETIQFASGLVGGGTAIYALLLSVQTRRSAAASRFVERYNDPSFAELRKVLSAEVYAGTDHTSDPQGISALLNFFEEMALAVNSKEADEEIARGFFFSVSGKFYRALEQQIVKLRKEGNQPTAFIEYEKLYRRWNN